MHKSPKTTPPPSHSCTLIPRLFLPRPITITKTPPPLVAYGHGNTTIPGGSRQQHHHHPPSITTNHPHPPPSRIKQQQHHRTTHRAPPTTNITLSSPSRHLQLKPPHPCVLLGNNNSSPTCHHSSSTPPPKPPSYAATFTRHSPEILRHLYGSFGTRTNLCGSSFLTHGYRVTVKRKKRVISGANRVIRVLFRELTGWYGTSREGTGSHVNYVTFSRQFT
ncbi:hypothetical protein L1987_60256 [Smallanthus sonchifolius]|uniref:Uncharacterized protein n=1 Tax=Smallanthus sonchifolius TaxID=185202 RepID=A0ACB9D7R8_9ASTR|nr:hypothetical protein L1987_60256 [Smallanthus sonchifolius]